MQKQKLLAGLLSCAMVLSSITIAPVGASAQDISDQMQQTISPVSYTHLDVYKRQIKTCGVIF